MNDIPSPTPHDIQQAAYGHLPKEELREKEAEHKGSPEVIKATPPGAPFKQEDVDYVAPKAEAAPAAPAPKVAKTSEADEEEKKPGAYKTRQMKSE